MHEVYSMPKPQQIETSTVDSVAVVVPFHERWHDAILKNQVRFVIRKRSPKAFVPSLYFYVNAPVSSIVGRASVASIDRITPGKALSLASALGLSEEDVRKYLGNAKDVGLYRLGDIETAEPEIALNTLHDRINFHPPQGFFLLRRDTKSSVDNCCRFRQWGDS